ncbi:MAG: LuxR C-terminal-related transcriptional regulator [Tahibacter sp.]
MHDWDEADAVLQLHTISDVMAAAARFAELRGYEMHGYRARYAVPHSSKRPGFRELGNFPSEWLRQHSALRVSDEDSITREYEDPRVQHVRVGLPVTAWTTSGRVGYTRADIDQRARALLRRARDFDMRGGITVPLHSFGVDWAMMTFATQRPCDLRDLAPGLAPTLLFASCLQVSFGRINRAEAPVPSLSPREREVLHWAAIGKTSWEISLILLISERTVNFHLINAARRLQVKGRGPACARALALGIISW